MTETELFDHFAGLAMAGTLASGGLKRAAEAGFQNAIQGGDATPPFSSVADSSYVMARAMIAARRKHLADIEAHPESLSAQSANTPSTR